MSETRAVSASRRCLSMWSGSGFSKFRLSIVAAATIFGLAASAADTAGYRASALVPPVGAGKSGFTQFDASITGISFTNSIAKDRYLTNQIYLNGSGVTAGDVDGDGFCDLYFCGVDGPNALYRNLGGWKFEDVAAARGVDCPNLDATGAAFADLDGDDDLDLVVNTVLAGTRIFINNSKGHFTPAEGPPLNARRAGMSIAMADVEGDGDLDLYVTNYRIETIRDQPNTKLRISEVNGKLIVMAVDGRPASDPDLVGRFTLSPNKQIIEHGEPDAFFLNDGKGRFTPVSFTGGTFRDRAGKPLLQPLYDWGLSVAFRDMNGDLAPDLYVCNDFESDDRIWINDGKGAFHPIEQLALRRTSMFSMGVDFGDVNRDGFDDFLVLDMVSRDYSKRHILVSGVPPTFLVPGQIDDRPQYSQNTLFLGRGDGSFAEVSQFSGVHASEWSWTPMFLDVDLDGFEDLLITTGHEMDMMNVDVSNRAEEMKAQRELSKMELLHLRKMFERFDAPNVAFRNRGDLTFEDSSAEWGFDAPSVAHGMAAADLDNDGDLDLAINNLNGLAGLYRNDSPAPRLLVRLNGLAPNTRGIGAKIRVKPSSASTKLPVQSQEIICGGRYLSSDDPARCFAAGADSNRFDIEVLWRSGKRTVVTNVAPNHSYEIDEPAAAGAPPEQAAKPEPWFTDIGPALHQRHIEAPFDDFERQPLLPFRLSQLGPGVTWADVDSDGWDDLIVGSGRGGVLAVAHNNQKGAFTVSTNAPVNRMVNRDQTTVLFNGGALLAGSSNYEDGLTNGGCIRVYDLGRKASGDSVLGNRFSVGPLAMADVDNDGDLDVFAGGRLVPGRYPEPADSLLLVNDGGRLVLKQRFEKLGLASAATFSDLDSDGKLELLVACELGPIRVFRVTNGLFVEITSDLGLANLKGLWKGIATVDLDGDGLPDIVASNWGFNSRYRASAQHPLKLYYGDLDASGSIDIVEARFETQMKAEVPLRGYRAISAALPFVAEKFPTYEAYAKVTLAEIYGDTLKQAGAAEATTLHSTVFMNRGGRFEPVPLPTEAQLSPAFGISTGDMDGDGDDDVFLAQNFFAVHPEAIRMDAGRGLWLENDGKGSLRSLSAQESGVAVYGEQRGCAVADFDNDGRIDLAVSQNAAATKLFRNTRATPGLRVRLKGPPGNPSAVGAAMRLVYSASDKGPLREIRAGSGYWSCDSPIQVLGKRTEPKQLWVRWPGGTTATYDIPGGAREVSVELGGTLTVLK